MCLGLPYIPPPLFPFRRFILLAGGGLLAQFPGPVFRGDQEGGRLSLGWEKGLSFYLREYWAEHFGGNDRPTHFPSLPLPPNPRHLPCRQVDGVLTGTVGAIFTGEQANGILEEGMAGVKFCG